MRREAMSAQGSSQSSTGATPTGATPTHPDDQQSQALVAALNGHAGPAPVHAWRELVSGLWLVFVRQGEQPYCLMPLAFSVPEGVP